MNNPSLELSSENLNLYSNNNNNNNNNKNGNNNPASIPTNPQIGSGTNIHSNAINLNLSGKKRKADVWSFFTEQDGVAICRCNKSYKYSSINGTSTLRHHAIRCHMCPEFPGNETNGNIMNTEKGRGGNNNNNNNNNKDGINEGTVQNTRSLKEGHHENTGLIGNQSISAGRVGLKSENMPPYRKPSVNMQLKTSRNVIEWILSDNLSFNLLEHPSFQLFMIHLKNEISSLSKDQIWMEMKKYVESLQRLIIQELSLLFPPLHSSTRALGGGGGGSNADQHVVFPLTENKCNLVAKKLSFLPSTASSFISLSISYIDEEWNLQSFLLSLIDVKQSSSLTGGGIAHSVEKLFSVICQEIDKYSLFPYIHTIQFDVGNFEWNEQLRQLYIEKRKAWFYAHQTEQQQPPQQHHQSQQQQQQQHVRNNVMGVTPSCCPIPLNVLLDQMAADLVLILHSSFLQPIRSIVHLFHHDRSRRQHYSQLKDLFINILYQQYPSLATIPPPILDSFYEEAGEGGGGRERDEEKIDVHEVHYSEKDQPWEDSYQMIKHFFFFTTIYETCIRQTLLLPSEQQILSPFRSKKLASLLSFLTQLSSSSSTSSSASVSSTHQQNVIDMQWKDIFQLLDWCYHTKHNNLQSFKPNLEKHCIEEPAGLFYPVNHLVFTSFYDFHQYLEKIFQNARTSSNTASSHSNGMIAELARFQTKYAPLLAIYDPFSSYYTDGSHKSLHTASFSSSTPQLQGFSHPADNNNTNNSNYSQSANSREGEGNKGTFASILEHHSSDNEIYFMSHILDPRFRLSFLQEITSERQSQQQQRQPHQREREGGGEEEGKQSNLFASCYNRLTRRFRQVYLHYFDEYREYMEKVEEQKRGGAGEQGDEFTSRILPRTVPFHNTTQQQQGVLSIDDPLSSSSSDENDDEFEKDDRVAGFSFRRRGGKSSSDGQRSIHNEQQSGNNNLTEGGGVHGFTVQSSSFNNNVAHSWLKKKAIALKYQIYPHSTMLRHHRSLSGSLLPASSPFSSTFISQDSTGFPIATTGTAAAVAVTDNNLGFTRALSSTNSLATGDLADQPPPGTTTAVADDDGTLSTPELHYYLTDYLFFQNIHHEKFLYSTYITQYYHPLPLPTSSSSSQHLQQQQVQQNQSIMLSFIKKAKIGYDFSILAWWKEHSYQFPYLSILAKHYLSIPVSSQIINFVTGDDWFEDFYEHQLRGGGGGGSYGSGKRSPLYEILKDHGTCFDGSTMSGGNSSSSELIICLLLGHHWIHTITRNQWK